jgi:hypothetical protein
LEFLKKIRQIFIEKNPRLTVSLLSFAFLICFYPNVLFHPGSYLLGGGGDGIKNYFCYEWHVQRDTSFVNYTGTSYPFGEQHAYTDGNPLLSNTIKTLPFLKSYSIALFNLSLMFSFVLTALLLFAILRRCGVPPWFAIIGAVGTAVLSPQTARLPVHFTLAYSFFIPLAIYLLLLSETENKKRYNWLTGLTVLLAFFVHPYMGMILASMVFLYQLAVLALNYRHALLISGWILVQAILPLLLYFAYIRLTDTHADRTSHPYGFFFYVASPESVLVSSLPPFRHLLSQIIKIHEQNWEGQAYIGISSLFAMLCLPFILFVQRKKIKEFISRNAFATVLIKLLFASLLLLLFSMAYPFKWHEEWLDMFPFIKQFRSPGRFAWAFYFVVAISSVVLLSKYLFPRRNSSLRTILISAILLLYVIEGIPFHRVAASASVGNCFDATYLSDEMKQVCSAIEKVHPQALIPLPYFHFGTEYFCFNPTEKIQQLCFMASFHTGTPLFANCTGRASLSEAKLCIQALGSNLLRKDIKQFIPSASPFCILYSKEQLKEWEEAVFRKGKTILETENYILKAIYPSELLADIIEEKKQFYKAHKEQLNVEGRLYLTAPSFVRYISYDSLTDQALEAETRSEYPLCEIEAGTLEKEKQYELSFWYDLKNGDELDNSLIVEQINPNVASDTLAYQKCNQCPDISGNKVLVSCSFLAADPSKKIRIRLTGNREGKGAFRLDDLLIRKKDVDVYQRKAIPGSRDSILVLNNFELK